MNKTAVAAELLKIAEQLVESARRRGPNGERIDTEVTHGPRDKPQPGEVNYSRSFSKLSGTQQKLLTKLRNKVNAGRGSWFSKHDMQKFWREYQRSIPMPDGVLFTKDRTLEDVVREHLRKMPDWLFAGGRRK